MVYIVKKHENGFTVIGPLEGLKYEFADETEVALFLSGNTLKAMDPGDVRCITDSEVVSSEFSNS